MKSVKYLLELQAREGLNDTALSKRLGVTQAAISHYKTGKRIMDEETCLAVAMALDFNEHQAMQVIMAAGIDRAEKAGQQSLWTVFSQRMAATAASALLVAGVTLFLTPEDARAYTYSPALNSNGQPIYIM